MAPVMFVCGWLNHQRQPQPRRQRQQRTLAAASAKAVFNEIFSFAARQAQRSQSRAEQAAAEGYADRRETLSKAYWKRQAANFAIITSESATWPTH